MAGSILTDNSRTVSILSLHPENRRRPALKRLWLAGSGLALFIATMVIANGFVASDKRVTIRSAGYDFLAFYAAGSFVRDGRVADLYDLEKVRAFERAVAQREGLELGDGFGPWWNPPVFAWVFVPIAAMPYPVAWWAWFAVNLACAAGAIAILCLLLKRGAAPAGESWRTWALVPLWVAVSLPFIQALGHGQNTCISLLIVSAVVWFWQRGNGLGAGLICGLLLYKPQLAAVIAGMLVITAGWRALAGLAVSGIALLAIGQITMPGAMHDWLHRLPALMTYMQVEHRYMWERHVTLKAFARLLVQGDAVGPMAPAAVLLWVSGTAALVFGLTVAVARTLSGRGSRNRLIAATLVSMPLLMPFYFDYDLLLLAVPAVLYAADRIGAARTDPIDQGIVIAWTALFAWLFINPFVAGWTQVNGTVLILSALAAMLIVKTCAVRDDAIAEDPASLP